MNYRHAIIFFAITLLALTVTGCNSATTPTPEAVDSGVIADEAQQVLEGGATGGNLLENSIIDTAWSVVTYGLEMQVPPVDDTTLTVNFMVDRYNGYTGCNYMLGVLNVGAEMLEVHWPSLSAATCEDEVLAKQESDFLTALTTADSYVMQDNQLQLTYGDVSVMTLDPLESLPFEGTTWNLQFIQQQPVGWVPPLDEATLTAVFDGGSISGNAGCNTYTGSYEIDGNKFVVSDLATTQKMCESEDLMQQETDYLKALQAAAIILQHPRSFELRDDAGVSMMIFGADE